MGTNCLLPVCCIFKVKVKPSQKLNNAPHEAWVVTNKKGDVITGHCTCMAGYI